MRERRDVKLQAFDPGLTQKYDGSLRRATNRDGTFNIRRKGARIPDLSLYLMEQVKLP
jgi:hypothetical protein